VEKEDTEEATLESEPFANVGKFSNGNNIENPTEKGSQGMVHNPVYFDFGTLPVWGRPGSDIRAYGGFKKVYIYKEIRVMETKKIIKVERRGRSIIDIPFTSRAIPCFSWGGKKSSQKGSQECSQRLHSFMVKFPILGV